MKNTTERIIGLRTRLGLLTLTLIVGSAAALGQGPAAPATNSADVDSLSGKYAGTMKSAEVPEEEVSLDFTSEGGKMSGRLILKEGAINLTGGSLKNGTLTLSFGLQALLVAKVQGDMLVGDLSVGADKHTVELKRALPGASTAPAASAPINLNGQWEAVADANGQPFPFSLDFKVDGENVTGSSSSQLGDSAITSGSWKNGKLVFQLEGQNGVVSLSATVVEGKLSGEFDFAGQLQGRWVAVKKN